jgi:ornithine carbamoyltransferase
VEHFLSLRHLDAAAIGALLDRAAVLKKERARGLGRDALRGKTLALILEKASTRTRVSFEVAMVEMGGHAVVLAARDSQLGRGEPARDTARVLSGYVHAIAVRTFAQSTLDELARHASVPVINALTDEGHPTQVLADLLTVRERLGADLAAQRYAWVGDGNNMANSWIEAAGVLGLALTLACPRGYTPDPSALAFAEARAPGRVRVVHDPQDAARGAQVVMTDVWASMGQEEQAQERARAFAGYCVDERLLGAADPGAIVLHCLPAHRGEEISDGAIEGPRSAVFAQAENRLHANKALLERLLAPQA